MINKEGCVAYEFKDAMTGESYVDYFYRDQDHLYTHTVAPLGYVQSGTAPAFIVGLGVGVLGTLGVLTLLTII